MGSRLQEKSMEEFAATFRATQARIERRLADAPRVDTATVVEDELRGLYHGLLVIFDGGSALANEGLVSVVDGDGMAFDRFLHEICFRYWPARRCERSMHTVHVFVSTGRFHSLGEIRAFIDKTFTENGEGVPSTFIREVGLSEYEPACIEAIPSESGRPVPLTELLAGASYSDQWLSALDGSRLADAAICVFAPNNMEHPEDCSLEYLGAFAYNP